MDVYCHRGPLGVLGHADMLGAGTMREEDQWIDDCRAAIEAYNDLVGEQVLFSDGLRHF